MQRTLIIIKPDAFMKKIVGKVIRQFEEEGFEMLGTKFVKMTPEQAGKFYIEHKGKSFYEPLVKFMSSNPCLVTVWGGSNVIKRSRAIIGKTDPADAQGGTIRERWARDGRHNIVHGADSPESAEREIEFFFPSGEGLYKWEQREYIKK